jgi:mono/diheme cytochrome c family protein
MRDGQMFHVISMGQGNMAAYASQVERQDRWKVIGYLRTLQTAPAATMAVAPTGETEEGI